MDNSLYFPKAQYDLIKDQHYKLHTVCALIFVGFIFRGFAIFAFFTFLNSRLLGTVVVKYSRIYELSPYTIIVYGGCIGAKLAGLVVGFV